MPATDLIIRMPPKMGAPEKPSKLIVGGESVLGATTQLLDSCLQLQLLEADATGAPPERLTLAFVKGRRSRDSAPRRPRQFLPRGKNWGTLAQTDDADKAPFHRS